MKAVWAWLGLAAMLVQAAGAEATEDGACAAQQARVEAEAGLLATAKDEFGALRSIGDSALAALRQCPGSARLWYLAARAAEVLEVPSAGQAFAASGGLKEIVAQAAAHAPGSAPVATVAARVDGGSAAARRALALDADYLPARCALAEALAREGAMAQALELVPASAGRGPQHLTRARVLLAAGRHEQAAQEARRAAPGAADELTPRAVSYRDAQEVLGLALLGLNRPTEARQALRAAAAAGSLAAQARLSKP